ncbi:MULTISPECIES: hypothetical protein [unclassified Nocardiopsis]|uniref:hypothetical protein n=1 Tax=unclassified Nocardiopsis TaxID=2649073 RepID=UPI0011615111|nr:hypothetical protein [Nocardiopsis sp. TSRI0078]
MQWADALADHFFHDRGQWARPVVLYVDDEIAGEVRQRYGLAVDLESAVRPMLYPQSKTAVYRRIELLSTRSARASSRPPASLPLLAATVLAASRMKPSGKRGQPPYYEPLRRVLGVKQPPPGHLCTAQKNFPRVVDLWKGLRKWAESWGGRYGVLVLPQDPRPSRIGYPLSQALIRRTDHEPLDRFLTEVPGTSHWSGGQLLEGLRDWQNEHRSDFSKKFADQLRSDVLTETWCDLLEAFRDSQYGRKGAVPAPLEGRGSIRVWFDRRNRSFSWVGEWPAPGGRDAFQVRGPTGEHSLERVQDSNLYLGLNGLPVTSERLLSGFTLEGEDISLNRSPTHVIPLIQSPDIEGFVEADAAQLFTQCCLLVHSSAARAAQQLLEYALPGAREITRRRLPGMPQNWSLYMRLRFEDPVRLRQALSRSSLKLGFARSPGRMKLSGGLRIRSVPETRTYLDEGLPEIALSGEPVAGADIDGRPLSGNAERTRLRLPGDLREGPHEVTADNAAALRFSVRGEAVDKAGRVPAESQCGTAVGERGAAAEAVQGLPEAAPRVRGCAFENLPASVLPAVAVAPRGADRLFAVGSDLSTVGLRLPARPSWRERVPQLSGSDRFEVEIRNGSGWLVQSAGDFSRVSSFSPPPKGSSTGPDASPVVRELLNEAPRVAHQVQEPRAGAWKAPPEEHGDVLLRWVSELGSGSVSELRSGLEWYARSSGLPDDRGAVWGWIGAMSALGHLDVAWRNSTWSCSPPAVTRVPYSDGLAAVTGERRRSALKTLLDRGPSLGLEAMWVRPPCPPGELPLPMSLLLSHWSPDQLGELASLTGAEYTPCFAFQAATVLPGTKTEEVAAGPRFDVRVSRYTPFSREGTGLWTEVEGRLKDGLYRWRKTDSRTVFRLRRGGSWFKLPKEVGVYAELQRNGISVLSWTQEPGPGRWRIGSLAVHRNAPLPPLHARTATLCSGLPARTGPGGAYVYDNVPWRIARAIAESLGQRVFVGIRQTAEPPRSDSPPPSAETAPELSAPGPRISEQDKDTPSGADSTPGPAPVPAARRPRSNSRFRERIDLGGGLSVTVDEAELALSRAAEDFRRQQRLGERERAVTERMRISQGIREFDSATCAWIRKVMAEQAGKTVSPADRMYR